LTPPLHVRPAVASLLTELAAARIGTGEAQSIAACAAVHLSKMAAKGFRAGMEEAAGIAREKGHDALALDLLRQAMDRAEAYALPTE
jgi:hypothetical protein